jgi:hypothetical protein
MTFGSRSNSEIRCATRTGCKGSYFWLSSTADKLSK